MKGLAAFRSANLSENICKREYVYQYHFLPFLVPLSYLYLTDRYQFLNIRKQACNLIIWQNLLLLNLNFVELIKKNKINRK